MRAIRFRVWDKSIKKWLFGYDYKNLGGFSLFGETILLGEFFHEISLDKLSNDDYAVMQYTGLKDSKGVEIYEGDILKLFEEDCSREKFEVWYEVIYSAPSFEMKVIKSEIFKKGTLIQISECYLDKIEVIGNIYKNPELLK